MTSGVSADELREEMLRQRLAGKGGGRRPRIERADRTQPLPLSFAQERMWFLNRLEPDSPEYLVPVAVRLRGKLDRAALAEAIRRLGLANEILRTRYALFDGRPVQVIDSDPAIAARVTDLTHMPEQAREDAAREVVAQEAHTPFDLERDTLVRFRLIRLADEEHVLSMVLHHIACDDWSVGILLRELGVCYRAAVRGAFATAEEEPRDIHYADYAAWQRRHLSGDRLERRLDYWRDQLSGLSPLELPTDRPRPAVWNWSGDRVEFAVPSGLARSLRELGHREQATPYMVLLTAYQVLLARYCRQQDVAVGSALAQRNSSEEQRLVGLMLNTVVLRARWVGEPSFRELLGRNRETVLEAIDHQDAPIQRLVDRLDNTRDLSRRPLFQVMFDMADAEPPELELPELAVEPFGDAEPAISKFDLTLQLGERSDGSMLGVLEYATALFDRSTAERITGDYLRLLRHVAENPDLGVSDLDIIGPAERALLLAPGPEPERPPECVHTTIARRAAEDPGAAAVTAGDAVTSRAELEDLAQRLARRLFASGLAEEDVVAVCLDRGPELLAALLGVWKAGGAYVPLDPTDPGPRLTHMLRDAGARVVVTDAVHAELVASVHAGSVIRIDEEDGEQLAGADGQRAVNGDSADVPERAPDPDRLAYMLYTSGSTGRPKGVMISHRGLGNYLGWAADTYTVPGGRGAPLFSSVAFDLSVTALFAPLIAGQPEHILPPHHKPSELGTLLSLAGPFDFVKLTPSHLEVVLSQLTGHELAGLCERLVVGGEAFTSRLLQRWRDAAGDGTRVVNEYGPTETTVAGIAFTCGNVPERGVVPIGRPIPGTTALVLDDELRPVPVGAIGELHIGGTQVARGYRGLPAATAERFFPDPYGPPGSRLYRTGDLARVLSDGGIEFVGRADEQIKMAGYRIEPVEVENALCEHPRIRESAVRVHQDDSGGRSLVAYTVCDEPTPPSPGELTDWLRQRLPEYLVPSAFVALDRLPLTANSKVDNRALPSPNREHLPLEAGSVATGNDLEEFIAAAWRESLGLAEVGALDNFFDLGGDSLRAVALVGELREGDLNVAVQDVFEFPTVRGLATQLAERPGGGGRHTPVEPFVLITAEDRAQLPADVTDAYPMSQVQAGMLVEMFVGTGANNYHNTTTYRINDEQPFSLDALRAAAKLVVARHEVLRTSLHLTSFSEPLQLVHRDAELATGARDLSGHDAAEQRAEITAFMQAERARLFDLDKPSLLRVFVHVCDDSSWDVTITECHAILEGWSYHILFMELLRTYERLRDGRAIPPDDEPGVRFADFIAAERASLASAEDRAYWRDIVAAYPGVELPTAWRRTADESTLPYQLEVRFDDLTDGLNILAAVADVPLKSVLHGVHLKVMAALTRQASFSSGLVCDGRPEVRGADGVLGMYLNTVPFPFSPGAATWSELVRQVFGREIELWPHRRFPVPAMQQDRTGGGRINEVMFNFLDFHTVDTDLVQTESSIDASPNEFALSVTMHRIGVIDLTIHPDLVSRQHGPLLAAMYRQVLEGMAADPGGNATDTPLPDEARDWAQETAAGPLVRAPARFLELFAERVRTAPDTEAVRATDGTPLLTYDELDERAGRLAGYLRGMGVGPETLVGICLLPSAELLVGILGVWKAGGAYVPLDPSTPPERLRLVLDGACPPVVVTWEHLLGTLPTDQLTVCLDRDQHAIDGTPSAPEACAEVHADHLAYVMHTSGSTGRPKGVLVTHGGLANYLQWAANHYGPPGADGAPMLGSAAFDLSITNLLLPLLHGRSLTLLPEEGTTGKLADLLRGPHDFTLLKLTPSHAELLLHELSSGAHSDSVRTFVVGGEALQPTTAQALHRLVPGARVVNEYGPTETVVGCCVHDVGESPDPADTVPIGRPIANTRFHVLDAWMNPLPAGVAGELFIGGAGVARGYLGRPDLTAERFVPDPFGPPGARLYRVGDLGRVRDEGQLEFLGRLDDQVKIRGYRIEPGEIAARLLEHEAVREAVVTASDTGRGVQLTAYLTVEDSYRPDIGQVTDFLGRFLPAYMIPTRLVVLDALPVGADGKLDRRALPQPQARRAETRFYTAPRTSVEKTLADAWAAALGVERVSVHDDFFELGGDSLLILRVVGAARQAGLPITPRQMLTNTTVAALAAVVDSSPRSSITAAQETLTGDVPAPPIQFRFPREELMSGGLNQSVHLHTVAPIDPDLLERALQALVAQHDMLRLRVDGERQYLVAAEDSPLLRFADLRHVESTEEQRSLLEQLVEEMRTGLDPFRGPMLRAVLVRFTDDGPDSLVIAAHRLCVDGISWQIIIADLAEAYRQLSEERPAVLPAKTTSFPHWIRRLTEYANAECAADQTERWLRDGPADPLPVDTPEEGHNNASACTLSVTLDEEHTAALVDRGPVRDVLLAALGVVLADWIGRNRIVVELEHHGREEDLFEDVDLTRTVGWFTTLFPFPIRVPTDRDMSATVEAVWEEWRALPDHGVSFGALRHLRAADRVTGLEALESPQVRFNYLSWQDGALPAAGLFRPVLEGTEAARSAVGERTVLLEVDASIHAERLTVNWTYSPFLHGEDTVRRLAEHYLDRLRTFVS